MAVITRLELENAQRDVATIGSVVNGAADLANPGKPLGTVQSRTGATIKTLARVAADGTATVEALLTPLVYETFAAMDADKTALVSGVLKVKAGQTAYCRETTQIYILTSVTVGSVTTRTWEQVSDLAQAASAADEELLLGVSPVGRVSVTDYGFLREYDRFLDKNALDNKFIKWPGKPTTGEGLAKLFTAGATSWPSSPWGQEGVDFGVPTALLSGLVAGNTHPAWTTPNRILIKPDSVTKIVDGYTVLGIININNAVTEAVYIRNSIIDAFYNGLTAVQQDGIGPVHISNCILRNFIAQSENLYNGTIKNCLIENSKGDGLKGDMLYGGVIYNCLVRKLGQIDPSAHADAMQCQRSTNMSIIGNTFYMPGTGKAVYDEGTYGTTQCLRIVTEDNTLFHKDLLAVGNLLVGGGYTVAVRSRYANGELSTVENVIIGNNMLGGPDYHLFGHITAEHGKSTGSVGVIRNLLMHNNRDITGAPMSYAGINQNGLWHYDKSKASPRFLDLAKRWGYLDWNGDLKPGIVSRTEVNQAAGTIP